MGSATSLTAAEMQSIRDKAIVAATVNGSGFLILTQHDGTQVNAGYVQGSVTPESVEPTPNTLARRDVNGRVKFEAPIDIQEAATKGYVDQAVTDVIRHQDHLETDLPGAYDNGTTISDGGGVNNYFPTSPYATYITTRINGSRTIQVGYPKEPSAAGLPIYRSALDDNTWSSWFFLTNKSYVDAKTWDAATDLTGTLTDANLPQWLWTTSNSVNDFDAAVNSGFYKGNNAANAPGSSTWYYVLVLGHSDHNYAKQVAFSFFGNEVYERFRTGGTWQPWVEISGPTGAAPGSSSNVVLSGTAAPSTFPNGLTIGRTGAGAGWPVAAWAPVHVFKAGNDEDVTQIVYMRGNGTNPNRTYVRSSTYNGAGVAATWGVWREISQTDGVWYTNFSSVQTNILMSSVTNAAVAYMLEGPWVVMTGLVGRTGGWSTSANTLCFSLPSNARPLVREFFPAPTTEEGRGANGSWAIEPDGTVTLRPHTGAYGAGYYSFSGIRFYRG